MANITTGATSQTGGVAQFATGSFTSTTSSGQVLNIGFKPRYFQLFNITDGLYYTKAEGMADANTLLNTGSTGVVTTDTASSIVFGDSQTTILTGILGASKACVWQAWG